jgi:protein-glutamine gamma-glutamyltransferase
MGAALLFWGWQSGYLIIAAVMAVVLESAHFVKVRWEFSDRDFDRLWNFTTLLFVGAMVIAFTSHQGPGTVRELLRSPTALSRQSAAMNEAAKAMLAFIHWLPMVFFLFMMAQTFSLRPGIDLTTVSWIVRWLNAKARYPGRQRRFLNVTYPYFGFCLIAACTVRGDVHVTYLGLGGMLAWALWRERSQRYALSVWLGLVMLAMGLSLLGNRGLERARGFIENYSPEWFTRRSSGWLDARENRTSLGALGRLKLSGKILFRLEIPDGLTPPDLLREASYSTYKSPTWYGAGSDQDFQPIIPDADETSWTLIPRRTNGVAVSVAGYLPAGRGLLPLPTTVSRLQQLPVMTLQTNRLGVVRVDGSPGFLMFDCQYGSGTGFDSVPQTNDLHVPSTEQSAVMQIVTDLGLATQSAPQALRSLNNFFRSNFSYSLELTPPDTNESKSTPLEWFLLRHRSGHCEYFATAAVLLLRQAQIPARYTVGYAVQERSGRGYVVRERHAHAWCMVYYNRAWHEFDPTPPGWFQEEAQTASAFEWLTDFGSRLWFEITKFRYGQSRLRTWLLWFILPVIGVSFWRLFAGRNWKRAPSKSLMQSKHNAYPGLDSELYQLEEALAKLGLHRQASEPLSLWLNRCQSTPTALALSPTLPELLRLHYRYRFDPVGLQPSERHLLRTLAKSCLDALQPSAGNAR